MHRSGPANDIESLNYTLYFHIFVDRFSRVHQKL